MQGARDTWGSMWLKNIGFEGSRPSDLDTFPTHKRFTRRKGTKTWAAMSSRWHRNTRSAWKLSMDESVDTEKLRRGIRAATWSQAKTQAKTVSFARATTEALGNGAPCERDALGVADNQRFALVLEGIREGHQGASGGIRCPFCRASGASGGHQVAKKPRVLKGIRRPNLALLKF